MCVLVNACCVFGMLMYGACVSFVACNWPRGHRWKLVIAIFTICLAVCGTFQSWPSVSSHLPLPLQFPFAQEQNIIFVVSTTGEGEPPDHALRYWRKLKRKTLPSDFLKHINYTLLGEVFVCWGSTAHDFISYTTVYVIQLRMNCRIKREFVRYHTVRDTYIASYSTGNIVPNHPATLVSQ